MSAAAAPRTAKKKRTRWAIIAIVVAVVVVLAVAAPMVLGGPKKSTATVPTTAAAIGTLAVTTSADGQTEADDAYDVYPEVSGTVETVDVKVGDKVETGDELFTVDDASLRSAVRQAKAQLSQANQQVAAANKQVAAANQQVSAAKLQKLQAENNLDRLESQTGTRTATSSQIDEAERSVNVCEGRCHDREVLPEGRESVAFERPGRAQQRPDQLQRSQGRPRQGRRARSGRRRGDRGERCRGR